MELLLFRLYGPLAAWGEVAVGEIRGSSSRPTRSAILGLLAAALGVMREDDERHARLAEGLGVAARVDLPGIPLVDYHTVQWRRPKREQLLARSDELRVPRDELATVQSYRHYRCDGLATVGVWTRGSGPWALADLAAALERPAFSLFLGRKSCPLALPVLPRIIEAPSLPEAFAAYDETDAEPSRRIRRRLGGHRPPPTVELAWDDELPAGVARVSERRDEPGSRRYRRFSRRREAVVAVANPLRQDIEQEGGRDVPHSPVAE